MRKKETWNYSNTKLLPHIPPHFKYFALIGENTTHSLSPILHNTFFEQNKISAKYITIDTPPQELPHLLSCLHTKGFTGINVTHPYKEIVLKHVSWIAPQAKDIGASNTLVWEKDGYHAYNTDASGFLKSIDGFVSLKNKTIALLGAGGAARAVTYALLQAKVKKITIINRNLERLESLQSHFNHNPKIEGVLWKSLKDIKAIDGLINATSLSLESFSLDLQPLPLFSFLYDLNYTKALEKNYPLRTKNGLDMLIAQAAFSMAIWMQSTQDLYVPYCLAASKAF